MIKSWHMFWDSLHNLLRIAHSATNSGAKEAEGIEAALDTSREARQAVRMHNAKQLMESLKSTPTKK
jgi:hypothetical protein